MSKFRHIRGNRKGPAFEDTDIKTKRRPRKEESKPSSSSRHSFDDAAEVALFRSRLLGWYDQKKRDLPWRSLATTEKDTNIRTYAVWVSEVMLQQTRVSTVIAYYDRWMKKWPTVQKLSEAALEEVNQMWSGLGYYSRGRRLHEGALKVVREFDGEMPKSAEALLTRLPGVGRYTAAAIASIALGQATGAVDGNVIRVLCRVRAIRADSGSSLVTEALWRTADVLVDPERAGDFNQALMELGATVCTPKSPQCSRCPVQSHCLAYRQVASWPSGTKRDPRESGSVPDIEECVAGCNLCLSGDWDVDLGVQNFPRKSVKAAPRVERTLVCVLQRRRDEDDARFLLTQRPSKGLLAGMWELPGVLLEKGVSRRRHVDLLGLEVRRILGRSPDTENFQYVGEVVHIFSHIHQTYVVYGAGPCDDDAAAESGRNARWVTRSELREAAVSTGVKKIFKLYESSLSTEGMKRKPIGRAVNERRTEVSKKRGAEGHGKQLSIERFFTASEPKTS